MRDRGWRQPDPVLLGGFGMVKHIVLYKLREDCDQQAAVAEIAQALESLVGKVPGLLWLEVCPTYQGDADYALYSEFDSAEALADYQVFPEHVSAKEIVHKYTISRTAADYEF